MILAFGTQVWTAEADTLIINDPRETGTRSDVTRVVIAHRFNAAGRAGRVTVRANVGTLALNGHHPDQLQIWINTTGSAAPDYYATFRPDSGYDSVLRVNGWRTKGIRACSRWTARAQYGTNQTVTASIPRSCLGNPRRVQVTFRALYRFNGGNVIDWAPGWKRLSRPVAVSR
ncbi:DOMON domain-containing protein [Nocardioides jensenii]|uniref:hypothetical protein n=1 Tax=Nocardioides jensenii TaxID=1843 RepID=UPI000835EC36|nr:hypothetical protein [Nocardioides jensenii]